MVSKPTVVQKLAELSPANHYYTNWSVRTGYGRNSNQPSPQHMYELQLLLLLKKKEERKKNRNKQTNQTNRQTKKIQIVRSPKCSQYFNVYVFYIYFIYFFIYIVFLKNGFLPRLIKRFQSNRDVEFPSLQKYFCLSTF